MDSNEVQHWPVLSPIGFHMYDLIYQVRGRFGIGLGSVWGRFGVTLGSLRDHFGINVGSNATLIPKKVNIHEQKKVP